jgi:hypothetical protein
VQDAHLPGIGSALTGSESPTTGARSDVAILSLAAWLGRERSVKRAAAARRNGRRGGRPPSSQRHVAGEWLPFSLLPVLSSLDTRRAWLVLGRRKGRSRACRPRSMRARREGDLVCHAPFAPLALAFVYLCLIQ